MPVAGLKAGVRVLMLKNAPRLFITGIVFIIFTTVMTELIIRLPGTSGAYDLFLMRIRKGELPTLKLFFSNLKSAGMAIAALLWLLKPIVKVGYMRYCLKITRGDAGTHKVFFNEFLFFGKILIISVCTKIIIFLWSILFFFPAIPAYYRYRQAYFILLDAPDKSVLQCIRESGHIMAGNKLDLFLLDLSFAGWGVLNLAVAILLPVPFMLPLIKIWLTPYYNLTKTAYYNQLLNKLLF